MPIHIDIRVNEQKTTQIHIGRLEGFRGDDVEYTYYAVEGEYEDWMVPYTRLGVPFKHRYGDGLLTCIAKGLEAIDANPQ